MTTNEPPKTAVLKVAELHPDGTLYDADWVPEEVFRREMDKRKLDHASIEYEGHPAELYFMGDPITVRSPTYPHHLRATELLAHPATKYVRLFDKPCEDPTDSQGIFVPEFEPCEIVLSRGETYMVRVRDDYTDDPWVWCKLNLGETSWGLTECRYGRWIRLSDATTATMVKIFLG